MKSYLDSTLIAGSFAEGALPSVRNIHAELPTSSARIRIIE
jgi:hypothetical protein